MDKQLFADLSDEGHAHVAAWRLRLRRHPNPEPYEALLQDYSAAIGDAARFLSRQDLKAFARSVAQWLEVYPPAETSPIPISRQTVERMQGFVFARRRRPKEEG